MEAQLQIRQVGASSMYKRPRLDDFTPLYLPTGLQNAMEVQDYMKDLFDWQKDIKKKDKTILKHGDTAPVRQPAATAATAPPPPPVPAAAARQLLSSSSDSGLPAPRGRALTGQVSHAPAALQAPGILPAAMRHAAGPAAAPAMQTPLQGSGTAPAPAAKAAIKKRRKKVKVLPGDAKLGATAASHTYAAYKKWDTFDIDAALKSDDEEASEYESGSEEEEQAAAAAPAAATSAPSTVAAASASPATLSTLTPARAVNPSTTSGTSVTIAPREPLTSSDLSERSTVRTAAPAASRASHPSAATPAAAPSASHPVAVTAVEREVPPVRSQEPQTSEAWRARGNDLFKVRSRSLLAGSGHGVCLRTPDWDWLGAYHRVSQGDLRCGLRVAASCVTDGSHSLLFSPSPLQIGQWASALECYSSSLEYGPNCLAFANRAMARLKLEQWVEAEEVRWCSRGLGGMGA